MTGRLLTPSFVTNIAVALLLVGALVEIRNFSASARFVPALFAWATLVLVAVDLLRQVARVFLDRSSGPPDFEERRIPDGGTPAGTELLRVIVFVLAFWIAVFLLGFHGAPLLLVGAYLTFEAKVRWHIAFSVALIGNIGIVWAMKGIGVKVWTGALPTILPGMIGGENWPVF